jgi:hypothetical protein
MTAPQEEYDLLRQGTQPSTRNMTSTNRNSASLRKWWPLKENTPFLGKNWPLLWNFKLHKFISPSSNKFMVSTNPDLLQKSESISSIMKSKWKI